MAPKENQSLDDILKEALAQSEQHITFHEDDWDAMEELLDKHQHRKKILSLRSPLLIGAIAAMLLIACGLFIWYSNPQQKQKVAGIKVSKSPEHLPAETVSDSIKKLSGNLAKVDEKQAVNRPQISNSAGRLPVSQQPLYSHGNNSSGIDRLDKIALNTSHSVVTGPGVVTDTTNGKTEQDLMAATDVTTNPPGDTAKLPEPGVTVAAKKVRALRSRGQHALVLSVIAAPDFNGVHSAFNRTQIGVNAGFLLSVGVTSKLTISAGAIYAKKPYEIAFQDYHTAYKFKVQPTNVDADCRVLDIPLNVNYQVYDNGRNHFSVGTGLSSYFMLRESYHYDYYGTTATGPTSYNIRNKNRHLFGVLNLNANYQRRISSQLGINFQPYMKLPLTNIGYGRVNLKSTGIAVGASWYLNTAAKPK